MKKLDLKKNIIEPIEISLRLILAKYLIIAYSMSVIITTFFGSLHDKYSFFDLLFGWEVYIIAIFLLIIFILISLYFFDIDDDWDEPIFKRKFRKDCKRIVSLMSKELIENLESNSNIYYLRDYYEKLPKEFTEALEYYYDNRYIIYESKFKLFRIVFIEELYKRIDENIVKVKPEPKFDKLTKFYEKV